MLKSPERKCDKGRSMPIALAKTQPMCFLSSEGKRKWAGDSEGQLKSFPACGSI
jgi:hypothetical protein